MPPVLSAQMRQGDPGGAAEAPPPGWGETIAARFRLSEDRQELTQAPRNADAYTDLLRSLDDLGVDTGEDGPLYMDAASQIPGALRSMRVYDRDAIFAEVQRQRARDPRLFKALPATRKEFDQWTATRRGGREADKRTAARGNQIVGMIGDLGSGITDPYNLATGAAGFGGMSIAKTMLVQGLMGGGTEVLNFEGTGRAMARMGETYGADEKARDVAVSAGASAVLGGIIRGVEIGAPRAIDASRARFEQAIAANWDRLPAGLREKWGSAAKVDDTALPDIFEAIVGRDNMSIAEKGAVSQLRRQAEIDAANPFRKSGAGVEAYQAGVARNVERVIADIEGMRRPRTVAAAANGESAIASGTVPTAAPASGARAALKAKIGRAESPSDVAKNPRSSATGRYQFVSGTWLSYYKRRFGSQGLTDAQILSKRTDGDVQELLMDDLLADNARFLRGMGQADSAGNLYLTHFAGQGGARRLLSADARAAAADVLGADVVRANPFLKGMTAGDVIAWAHRKMDEPVPAGAAGRSAGVDVDPEAAVRAELADRGRALEAERATLDGEASARVADDPVAIEAQRAGAAGEAAPIEIAPGAELRRDLFPDDTSWRIAQAAVDAEARGLLEPEVTRQSVWVDARDQLIEAREGEVPGALWHDDVGPIDVKWGAAPAKGEPGFGLAKIAKKHPEVLDDLPRILETLSIASRSENRVVLESADHKAIVRLEWDGKAQTWLLSAYERKGKAPPRRTTDVPGIGARDGSPTREAADDIAENTGNRNGAADGLPMDRFWGDPSAPRDAGGLTAAERSSIDFEEAGLGDFVDPAGAGARLDLDGGVHDLRAAIETGDALDDVAFAARDGADETMGDVLASIDAEAAALKALRGCL